MPYFGAAAILEVASTLFFILSIAAGLFDLGGWSEGPPDDPAPWLDYFWIGSGVLSLLLAFYVENVEQNRRKAADGELESLLNRELLPSLDS